MSVLKEKDALPAVSQVIGPALTLVDNRISVSSAQERGWFAYHVCNYHCCYAKFEDCFVFHLVLEYVNPGQRYKDLHLK